MGRRVKKINDYQRGNALIFYHILLTNSLRKCMEITLKILVFKGLMLYNIILSCLDTKQQKYNNNQQFKKKTN